MNKPAQAILAQVEKLPAAERLAVADQLLANLDLSDPLIDQLWAAEAQARLDAWRAGRADSFSLHEVVAQYAK